jgi:hypothetical protein
MASPKYVHADVLDGGLLALKNNATKMILVQGLLAGDTYAQAVAKALATVTITSADLTITTSGSNRIITTATKSATASASSTATPDLGFIFTDGSARVLWATDETSDQPITSGNTVNFPALVYTSNQPT